MVDKTPSLYSEYCANEYSKDVSKEHKKKLGQFFTPLAIANFMASIADVNLKNSVIRILDPGCGMLILSCALVEALVEKNNKINKIEIDAYDTDASLLHVVTDISENLEKWGRTFNISIRINYQISDFLLSHSDTLSNGRTQPKYDFVIANPPYFKVKSTDSRLVLFNGSLRGQQNMYSLFLLASSNLLKNNGQLIYLIPRSFTSGLYFESFRNQFLKKVSLQFFHLFMSRKDGFKKDDVLQENLILKAKIRPLETIKYNTIISTSFGIQDLSHASQKTFEENQLVKKLGQLNVIHLPANRDEEEAIKIFSSWRENLLEFGMKVSTGPVVAFRSKEYLKGSKCKMDNLVPLLWMHNCFKMELRWPKDKKDKHSWILRNAKSDSKTIKSKNYILFRRFSSKDDKSKLIATPFIKNEFDYKELGIENHLNYLHMPNGEIEDVVVYGLSVLFNSSLFDAYLRSLIGNTQVSATELNSIPLPTLDIIKALGSQYLSLNGQASLKIDNIVSHELGVKHKLV